MLPEVLAQLPRPICLRVISCFRLANCRSKHRSHSHARPRVRDSQNSGCSARLLQVPESLSFTSLGTRAGAFAAVPFAATARLEAQRPTWHARASARVAQCWIASGVVGRDSTLGCKQSRSRARALARCRKKLLTAGEGSFHGTDPASQSAMIVLIASLYALGLPASLSFVRRVCIAAHA